MNLNFIWTGGTFSYAYYLAILSAMRVHKHDEAILWTTCGDVSPLITRLKSKGLLVQEFSVGTFPALANRTKDFAAAAHKDFLMWQLAYSNGGIFLDLDTISLKDISYLLRDHDLVVPLDIESEDACEHPFNNAIVVIRRRSFIARRLWKAAESVLHQPQMKWGDTGPALLTGIVKDNRKDVYVTPYRALGGYGGHEVDQIYSGDTLLPSTIHVLHAFAATAGNKFTSICPRYIETSKSPYAQAVRSVLDRDEWDIFTTDGWCEQRGQHYRAMFDYLNSHEVRKILEIGVFNGDNAIGMIESSAAPSNQIAYYGFDLFEDTTGDVEVKEATTGYNKPPTMEEVFRHIRSTGATVNLYRGDSKRELPLYSLPIMDFIYIDGGHSKETIRADWANVQKCIDERTVIFFDDYFIDRDDLGCKFLAKEIDPTFEVRLENEIDTYEIFKAQLLEVRKGGKVTTINTKALRFHLLGLAHVPTHKDVTMCAYTQKVLKLSKMLTDLGHEVIFYGGEGSDVQCTEYVQCISNFERVECYGEYDWRTEFFKHSGTDSAYTTFNANAVREINKRKEPHDILLVSMGNYQKPVSDGTGLLTVESGIGYEGVFADYRVFESYAWMHHIYGKINVNNGMSYDCVIPNYFYPEDFPYQPTKDDYFLYMGRLTERKGYSIAIETTRRIGATLFMAGQGTLDSTEPHVTHVGSVTGKARAALIGNAKAVFVPTMYIEPFGGIAVEAMMCGTPVITSDWGAFTETVLHGRTGYRCRTLDDYVWAASNIKNINPGNCRDWAVDNFSANRVALMYDEYLHKITDLWRSGWPEVHPDRKELSWLTKEYPR